MSLSLELKEVIAQYVDGHVTSEESLRIEKALQDMPEARDYCQELRRLDEMLNAWTMEPPSMDWERRIESALRLQQPAPVRTHRLWLGVGVGAGVAVLVFAVVIVSNAYLQRGLGSRLRSTGSTDQMIGEQFRPHVAQSSNQPASSIPSPVLSLQGSEVLNSQPYEPYSAASQPKLQQQIKHMDVDIEMRDQLIALPSTATNTFTRKGLQRDFSNLSPSESWRYNSNFHTEEYDRIYENRFLDVKDNPLSTFSIDVDTASYSNVRRFLVNNQLPPKDAVRIEEMINYFTYHYDPPQGEAPFSITTRAAQCPWDPTHHLTLVGLHGKVYDEAKRPESNLVFLIDVSGSMDEPNKLPLLQSAFKAMTRQLTEHERVAIVVYAGAAGQVLDSTPGMNKEAILSAIDGLKAGGSTAGGEGITLAYEIAKRHFIKGGNNRVVLATDGDFNVGVTSNGDLVRLIEEKRQEGIFLTVLGFGTGNYKDAKMEQIADKGNGNYYYIDTEREGAKVLVQELGSTLFTIAKDVKIQIEFNPAHVKAYRLVGYENRVLAKEDFNDDTKDAGELGAGHTVTALYELIPAGSEEKTPAIDPLTYQATTVVASDDLMTVKLRYKEPDGQESRLLTQRMKANEVGTEPEGDFLFASAVAEFGLLLRDSQWKGRASYDHVRQAAEHAKGDDPFGYRKEFLDLVSTAQHLSQSAGSSTNVEPRIHFKGKQP